MKVPDELLTLLDEQITLLHSKQAVMERMELCLRKGDAAALAALIEEEAAAASLLAIAEQGTARLRGEMAHAAGAPLSRVTLSSLAAGADAPMALALNDRRERLLAAVQRLQAQAERLGRLARFSLDLNSRLMAALLGDAAVEGTYSADGAVAMACSGVAFEHSV